MRWQGGRQSENLEDRRRRGPSRGGLALGGGAAVLVSIVMYFLGVDPRDIQRFLQNANVQQPGAAQFEDDQPETPEEIRAREFAATILAFTEDVWDEQFRQVGERYERPHMKLFSRSISTGCGDAPSAIGPFYCPADRTVYLDPTFFDELEGKLGGSRAEFSQAYVIAHEIGHHVQNLLGYSELAHRQKRSLSGGQANEWSVRLELQADYLAGVWAHYGQQKYDFIEPGDLESAIRSANAIGDDRLQARSGRFVSPERFTHGTSAQRVKWFRRGFETGDLSLLKKIFEMPYSQL